MSDGMKKSCELLELNKILNLLSEKTSCDDSKKLIKKIIPSTDLKTVNKLLKETSDAHMLIARFGVPSFSGLSNIKTSVKKAAAGATLTTLDLIKIADNIHVFNFIKNFKEQFETLKTALDTQFSCVISNKYLENRIKTCIVSEDEIADEASSELLTIRRKINRNSDSIRDQLERMLRSKNIQKYLQENIITVKSEHFVLPVRTEFRKEVSGLVHETSASGATVFIEPAAVVELNNEIKILRQKEKNEIEKILKNLSKEVSNFADNILKSYDACVNLDIIFAKALLAHDMKAVLPKVNSNGKIMLKKARHPLVEAKKVVPTNISLGETFDSLVITGPNTGGKTVILKTVGLFVLMAMCGLMLPTSEESEISIFDYILVDIGDEQSIEQSLSTFSSHMINMVEILSVANKNSLILLDELGAGTDPVEGAALAIAIIETLKEKGCKIISTTHYSELKEYAFVSENVENGSCEFDVKTLKPKYNLLLGIPGSSNAFAIASRLGISPEIIKSSKAKIDNGTRSFEGLIGKLEKQRIELENKRESTEKKLAHAEKMYAEAEKMRAEFNKRIEEETAKAQKKAAELTERARSSADYVFGQLQELQRKKDSEDFKKQLETTRENVRKSLGMLSKEDALAEKIEVEYVPPREFEVGDSVQLSDLGKKGEIVSIDGENVVVAIGSAKIKTKKSKLRLVQQNNVSIKKNVVQTPKKNSVVKSEIDVRGCTCDEAIFMIDKFIDDAMLSSLSTLRVIHGKGTGALRKGLWDYFKHDSRISEYRMGTFGEGDAGVTVLTLK